MFSAGIGFGSGGSCDGYSGRPGCSACLVTGFDLVLRTSVRPQGAVGRDGRSDPRNHPGTASHYEAAGQIARGHPLSSHRPVGRPSKAPGRARDRSTGKSLSITRLLAARWRAFKPWLPEARITTSPTAVARGVTPPVHRGGSRQTKSAAPWHRSSGCIRNGDRRAGKVDRLG
jgi:hypothetical protein